MTIDEKQKIKEDFEWWITSIPDKVLELQKEFVRIPKNSEINKKKLLVRLSIEIGTFCVPL